MNRIPLICAAVLTLADVAKPVVVDDPAYLFFARQIVANPARMYGPSVPELTFHWYQHPIPAFEVLCPPVVPYWLALGMSLFGESVPLLKLWMFPFAWLFARSVDRLLRWVSPPGSSEAARSLMVLAAVLSPVFLPALNLMLDIPAMALGLAGVAVFVGGLPAPRWWRGVLSGLLIGLAMQTKYSTLLMPAVVAMTVFGYGLRVVLPGIFCAVAVAAVFVGWEVYIDGVYGQSHFVFHSGDQFRESSALPVDATWRQRTAEKLSLLYEEKVKLTGPLFGLLGLLAPGLVMLAWLALGLARRWLLVLGIGFLAFGAVGLMALPVEYQIYTRSPAPAEYPRLTFTSILCTVWSTSLVFALVGILARLHVRGWSGGRPRLRFDPVAVVLTVWLLLEVLGFFMLTPFAASRRVMGLIVVFSLLIARLLSTTVRTEESLRTMRTLTVAGLVWSSLFAVTDIVDARIEKVVPERVARSVRAVDPGATVWFCGHWGVQYYAERAGLKMIDPDASELAVGDFLALPTGERPDAQRILLPPDAVRLVGRIDETAFWPLKTIGYFYGGGTPLAPHEGPRVSVEIYRVERAFVPATDRSIYD